MRLPKVKGAAINFFALPLFMVICGVAETSGFAQTSSTNAATLPARSFLGVGGIATTPERKASPRFAGRELPLPPHQNDPWSPLPSSLPSNYVSAAAALFAQGMADPRGCDYREIEIGTGNVWSGDGGVVKTRGWVFSGMEGQRFAVSWNGMVYPVITVGAAADWQADAKACVQSVGRLWRSALPEAYEVSYQSCLPLKGCLLLRLGDSKIAGDLWLALQASEKRDFNTNLTEQLQTVLGKEDPYLRWASDWAWDVFERAVCAHMRGDDGLALASARLLSSARPQIEAAAERRAFKRQPAFNSPWDGNYQDYLSFLSPLAILLADQERRAQSARKEILSPAEIATLTNQTARIAAWIDALDEIALRQSSQPGGLGGWERDAVVAGLIKEGEPAIEPLLQCLESDCANRLTRCVSFGRDFHRGRYLHDASQPIIPMLLRLLNASDLAVGFDSRNRNSNATLVVAFRNYWKNFAQLPLPERWYRRLADDAAGQAAWTDALASIVQLEQVPGATNKSRMAGEDLRSKTSPTVTDLLLRRCTNVVDSAPSYDRSALREAAGFLLNAATWESPPRLLQIADTLQTKIGKEYNGRHNIGSTDPQISASLAGLATMRARHGDEQGLAAYSDWIVFANPFVLEDSALDALEPLWRFPNNPSLRSAAKMMFESRNSAWASLTWLLESHGHLRFGKALASPALVIHEFRAVVLNELGDGTYVGEAAVGDGGNVTIKYSDGATTRTLMPKETQGLVVGAKFRVRRCDVVVQQLSAISNFPTINLLQSETKRNEAVTATVKLLKLSGHRLKPVEKRPGGASAFDPPLVRLED